MKKGLDDDQGFKPIENYTSDVIKSVELGKGWEVTELRSNLDLEIELVNGKKLEVSFKSLGLVSELIEKNGTFFSQGYDEERLFIVDEITLEKIERCLDSIKG